MVKRYDPYVSVGWSTVPAMEENASGEYVCYEDFAELYKEHQKQVLAAEHVTEQMRQYIFGDPQGSGF